MDIFVNLKKLFGLFTRREKFNSFIMLGLILVGGLVETLGIGLILPFATVLFDQSSVERYPILQTITEIEWIGGHRRFVVLMCFALVTIFLFKSLYMFFLIYIQNRFILNRQIEIARKLFQSYIHKPYEFFFNKNSAELQRNVVGLVPAVTQGVLMASLTLLTELVTVVFILILLVIIDPVSSLTIIFALGGITAIFYHGLKGRLETAAKKENIFGTAMFKSVNEGLGSIKEIKVLGKENNFTNGFEQNSRSFAKVAAFYNLCAQSPRLLIEMVAILGLTLILVINVLRNLDMNALMPMIAMFALAAIRLMPSMNRIISSMTSLRFNIVHFGKLYDDLKESTMSEVTAFYKGKKTSFLKNISIQGLTYKYPGTEKNVLGNVNLTIEKGQAIGIVGSSGAGKTTFVDILLGLLPPTEGDILIDGISIKKDLKGWQQNIGYVPQSIFLIDNTIAANVAFGVPKDEIDTERVWHALETANLKEFVETLSEKLDENVGESGKRLSGGQKQRIGIARALYHDPEMLIFDEATSSLDNESERIISEAIATIGNTKTMIIIAHRLNTLEKCDVIYEVKDKSLYRKESP